MSDQLECRLCGKKYNSVDNFSLACNVVYQYNGEAEGLVIFVCPDCFKKYKTEIMSMLMLDYLDIVASRSKEYSTAINELMGDERLGAIIHNFKKKVLKDDNDEPLDGDEAIVLAAALLQLINFHQGIDDEKEWRFVKEENDGQIN